MIKPIQVKMARVALGWGVRDLAARAGIAANTVSRFENGAGAHTRTLERIEQELEKAGIVFIRADETGGPGVRLKNNTG